MSYINEALKKAQKEKDTRYSPYVGLLKNNYGRNKVFGNRWIFGLFLFLILILLVFGFHSWLDQSVKNTDHDVNAAIPLTQPLQNSPPEKESEKNINDIYTSATLLYKKGNIREAKKAYEDILELDPGYVDALNNLGVLCLSLMDYTAAENYFEKAVRLKPAYVDPYYNLACLHAIKGDVNRSLAYLKKAVSLNDHVRDWARKDSDLVKLKNLPEFNNILNIGL